MKQMACLPFHGCSRKL